jgi:hypothetical protein
VRSPLETCLNYITSTLFKICRRNTTQWWAVGQTDPSTRDRHWWRLKVFRFPSVSICNTNNQLRAKYQSHGPSWVSHLLPRTCNLEASADSVVTNRPNLDGFCNRTSS